MASWRPHGHAPAPARPCTLSREHAHAYTPARPLACERIRVCTSAHPRASAHTRACSHARRLFSPTKKYHSLFIFSLSTCQKSEITRSSGRKLRKSLYPSDLHASTGLLLTRSSDRVIPVEPIFGPQKPPKNKTKKVFTDPRKSAKTAKNPQKSHFPGRTRSLTRSQFVTPWDLPHLRTLGRAKTAHLRPGYFWNPVAALQPCTGADLRKNKTNLVFYGVCRDGGWGFSALL